MTKARELIEQIVNEGKLPTDLVGLIDDYNAKSYKMIMLNVVEISFRDQEDAGGFAEEASGDYRVRQRGKLIVRVEW